MTFHVITDLEAKPSSGALYARADEDRVDLIKVTGGGLRSPSDACEANRWHTVESLLVTGHSYTLTEAQWTREIFSGKIRIVHRGKVES